MSNEYSENHVTTCFISKLYIGDEAHRTLYHIRALFISQRPCISKYIQKYGFQEIINFVLIILTFKLQIQPVSILFLIPDLYKYLVVLNANTDHFLQLFIIKFSVLSQKIVSNIVIFMLHGVKWPYFTPQSQFIVITYVIMVSNVPKLLFWRDLMNNTKFQCSDWTYMT